MVVTSIGKAKKTKKENADKRGDETIVMEQVRRNNTAKTKKIDGEPHHQQIKHNNEPGIAYIIDSGTERQRETVVCRAQSEEETAESKHHQGYDSHLAPHGEGHQLPHTPTDIALGGKRNKKEKKEE